MNLMTKLLGMATLGVLLISPFLAQAQQTDSLNQPQKLLSDPAETPKLKDMLEEKKKVPVKQEIQTGNKLANEYFIKCVSEKKPRYTTEIQEYLCGCSAARISQYLSPEEITVMSKQGKQGDNARDTFLIHAYTPCMQDVIKEVALNSCKNSDYLKKNVIIGRMKVCQCMIGSMKEYFDNDPAGIMLQVIHANPMSIDPLHDYMGTHDYTRNEGMFTQNCYNAHVRRR